MDVADFAAEYKTKSDEELLRIHYDAADLTDEARLALASEMHSRSLDKSDVVAEFRKQEQRIRKDDELARVNYGPRKAFTMRFGKADYEYDPESGIETFTTTLFVNLSSLPIIPIATYRVEKKKGWRYDFRILTKLPFDWQQVLQAWSFSAIVILLGIALVVILVPRFHR